MKLAKVLWGCHDGGKDSNSRMWGLEVKGLFSALVLNFRGPSREAFHTHAFNSYSWLVRGYLLEHFKTPRGAYRAHTPSWRRIVTKRETCHQVHSYGCTSWVITFRGPWADDWKEYRKGKRRAVKLTHGRRELR